VKGDRAVESALRSHSQELPVFAHPFTQGAGGGLPTFCLGFLPVEIFHRHHLHAWHDQIGSDSPALESPLLRRIFEIVVISYPFGVQSIDHRSDIPSLATNVPSVIVKPHLDPALLRHLRQSAELIARLFNLFAHIHELVVVVPRFHEGNGELGGCSQDGRRGRIITAQQFRGEHRNFQTFCTDRRNSLGKVFLRALGHYMSAPPNRQIDSSEAGALGAQRQLPPG